MDKAGKLVLKNGMSFPGRFSGGMFGVGEVVFNTSVTGHQEVLTDPSHCGQIVVMTYPLIGNYGVNQIFSQSRQSFVRGCVVGELCDRPSNWRSQGTMEDFLRQSGVPCLTGVDTRAVTRAIRDQGAMRGVVAPAGASKAEIEKLLSDPEDIKVTAEVTVRSVERRPGNGKKVAVLDLGVRVGMLESLSYYGCDLTVYPAFTPPAEIMAARPDGIFLSSGPGDPQDLTEISQTVGRLIESAKPVFGVSLGYQLICRALGADTYKMKFGHRGVNQPVRDLETGRVFVTSQNHGYAVKEETLAGTGLKALQRNVNDRTLEGVRHESRPLLAVQYYPEVPPGLDGRACLFKRFVRMMEGL